MTQIAILGLGIVGGGVVDVLTQNASSVAAKVGDEVSVKYILDIKDLSAHPMADRVITVKSGTVVNMVKNDHITDIADIEW